MDEFGEWLDWLKERLDRLVGWSCPKYLWPVKWLLVAVVGVLTVMVGALALVFGFFQVLAVLALVVVGFVLFIWLVKAAWVMGPF